MKDRETDPLKQWKISPIDKQAKKLWNDYSEARNEMLLRTNFKPSPWFVVDADNKDDTHIALISHILIQLEYQNKDKKMLVHHYKQVYRATSQNIKEKVYL